MTKVKLRQYPGPADPVTTSPVTKPSVDPLYSVEVSPADKHFLYPVPTKCSLDQAVGPVDRAPVNPVLTFSLDTRATLDQAAGPMDRVPVKPGSDPTKHHGWLVNTTSLLGCMDPVRLLSGWVGQLLDNLSTARPSLGPVLALWEEENSNINMVRQCDQYKISIITGLAMEVDKFYVFDF